MLRVSAVLLVVLCAMLAGAWIQEAIAADAPNVAPAPGASAPGDRGGGRDPAAMQQRMDQFRQQMETRLKESLGATDEEWKVLQPRIEKVMTLAREARGGGMGSMFGGRNRGGDKGGDRGGATTTPSDRPQSDTQKKADELQKLLQDKESKPEQIKAALAALREARAKAKALVEAAQKELREVLNMRQEATLVMNGMLD